jgi:transposase-like protein
MVLTAGPPIARVAKELEQYDSTLGNWVRQAEVDAGKREGATTDDAQRIRELEERLAKVPAKGTCSNDRAPSGTTRLRRGGPSPLRRCPEG